MSDEAIDKATLTPMELRKLARTERRGFKQSEGGVLAQTILGAMKIRDQMKAQGSTREELDHYMEGVVRTAWPKQRAEPWHYLCDKCRDTGLVIYECTPGHRCDGISTLWCIIRFNLFG